MGKHTIRLRDLLRMQSEKWLAAWLLGALTLLAAVALLAVSGWFISAAAAAGMAALAGAFIFDYFRPAAIIRALAIIRTAGRYGERLASHNAVLALLRDLRVSLFAGLAQRSNPETVSVRAMQRLTGDIDLLDNLPLRFFLPWLWALLLQTAFLLWLAVLAPRLAVAAAIPLSAAGVVLPALAAAHGISIARQDADGAERRRELLLEPLGMLTPLLLWRRWPDFRRMFIEADQNYGRLKRRGQALASFYAWAQQCLLALLVGLILWQGLPLLQQGAVSVPLLLAAVLAAFGLNEVLLPLTAQLMAYGFAAAARDRLNALDAPAGFGAAAKEQSFQTAWPGSEAPAGNILTLSVQNLSAKQQGALNGVQNVSFTLSRGEALLIRGKSGCGKSTLLDVLAGELMPQSGRLKMDGQPYCFDYANYLAQQVDIFDMTLADNLRLGDEALTDGDLRRALEQVHLADWMQAQPQGTDTPLGEYGAAVSGGQARRIALARLLLRPKPVLLLDEPFAGLDETARAHIWAALRQSQRGGWLIMASHHLPPGGDYRVLDLDKQA